VEQPRRWLGTVLRRRGEGRGGPAHRRPLSRETGRGSVGPEEVAPALPWLGRTLGHTATASPPRKKIGLCHLAVGVGRGRAAEGRMGSGHRGPASRTGRGAAQRRAVRGAAGVRGRRLVSKMAGWIVAIIDPPKPAGWLDTPPPGQSLAALGKVLDARGFQNPIRAQLNQKGRKMIRNSI